MNRPNRLCRALLFAVSLALVVPAAPLQAQGASDYAELLARVRANPADAEASFRFAQVAAQMGDFRAAIAALERVLILNPDLANIKLELGVLYLRTGATELGETFIRDALRAPDAPPAVRERAEELLTGAEEANRRFRFAASASGGLVHDSNANSGPDAGPAGATGQSDTSAFLGLTAQLRYDLGLQDGHLLAFDASYYGRAYNQQGTLGLSRFAVAPGIDLNLGRAFGRPAELQLRLEYSELARGGETYLRETGATTALRLATEPGGQVQVSAFWYEQDYVPTTAAPVNDNRDGQRSGLGVRYVHPVGDGRSVTFGADYTRKSARQGFEAYGDLGLLLGYGMPLRPLVGDRGPWRLDLVARAGWRTYDAADPLIVPLTVQSDTRLGISASLSVPVTDRAFLQLEAGHLSQTSSVAIRSFDNTYVSLGITRRF